MTPPPYRLLHVEDEPVDARLLGMMLGDLKVPYTSLHHVATLEAAVRHLQEHPVDLVFLDLDLPDSGGLETVRSLLATSGVDVPVVVLTGHGDEELGLAAVASGAQDYLVKDHVNANVVGRVMRYAVERHRVQMQDRRLHEQAYDGAVEGWGRVLELRDHDTMEHSRRVADHALAVAFELGLPDDEIEPLRRGALLHDIGKIGVPDALLRKRGRLSAFERSTMEQHTVLARDLLEPIAFLKSAIDVPYAHHERWDGSGYPRGLAGEDIPLAARIFAVVDVYDALTRDRPYRRAWSRDDARSYIEEEAGHLFDPAVVAAFMAIHG